VACPRCPLYLRDSPRPCTSAQFQGLLLRWVACTCFGGPPLSNGVSPANQVRRQLSVLLPERCNRCNQPFFAFGGPRWAGSLLNAPILMQACSTLPCRLIQIFMGCKPRRVLLGHGALRFLRIGNCAVFNLETANPSLSTDRFSNVIRHSPRSPGPSLCGRRFAQRAHLHGAPIQP